MLLLAVEYTCSRLYARMECMCVYVCLSVRCEVCVVFS